MSHTEPTVGFLGDSITLGWGLTAMTGICAFQRLSAVSFAPGR